MAAQLRGIRTPHDLRMALIDSRHRARMTQHNDHAEEDGMFFLRAFTRGNAFSFEARDLAATVAAWPSARSVDTWGRDLVRAAVEA